MRALGLDLGRRTLGLAISDPFGIFAQPLETIRFPENRTDYALKDLLKYIDTLDEKPILVLGLPMMLSGENGVQAEYCLAFKELLEQQGFEVVMIDERLTTVMAYQAMHEGNLSQKKRKERVDSMAASIILQTYLDQKGATIHG